MTKAKKTDLTVETAPTVEQVAGAIESKLQVLDDARIIGGRYAGEEIEKNKQRLLEAARAVKALFGYTED